MITPEQAQKITDLRSIMLRNIAADKPAHDGIGEDQLREAISFIRSNRNLVGKSLDKEGKPKKAKAAKPSVVVDTKAFTDINLD